jgi:hypothetical protein
MSNIVSAAILGTVQLGAAFEDDEVLEVLAEEMYHFL